MFEPALILIHGSKIAERLALAYRIAKFLEECERLVEGVLRVFKSILLAIHLPGFHQVFCLNQSDLTLFLGDVLGWACHGLSLPQQPRQLSNGLIQLTLIRQLHVFRDASGLLQGRVRALGISPDVAHSPFLAEKFGVLHLHGLHQCLSRIENGMGAFKIPTESDDQAQ